MSDKDWCLLECVICSEPSIWADEEGDYYCEKCKEDWPNE